MIPFQVRYIGNKELLKQNCIGFLSSRTISDENAILCKQWIKTRIKEKEIIVCGDITTLEKEIISILLASKHQLILVLAIGFKPILTEQIQQAIKKNRILVATALEDDITAFSKKTAEIRNKLIIKLSKSIYLGSVTKGGNLEKVLKKEIYSKVPKSILNPQNSKEKSLPNIENKKLFETLRQWRLNKSREKSVPAYFILSQRTLIEISNKQPKTMEKLLEINGIGKVNSVKYGNDILELFNNNADNIKTYSVKEVRQTYLNAYKTWTAEEDNKLAILFFEGKAVKELSNIFGRNEGAIHSRIKNLELIEKYRFKTK